MPVAAHLLVLLQKLHREEQQVVKVEGIVCRQCLAVTPVDIGGELAPLTFSIGLELIGKPALVFGVADRPTGLLGVKALGIQLQFLRDDFLNQALGISFVVDRKLLGPGESFGVLEFVDVVAEHPRKQRVEGTDPEFFGDFAVDARTQLTLLHRRQGAPGLAVLTLRQLLGQEQLKPLLHLPSGLVGEGNSQNLRRICTVLPNQVGNAMGQGPGFAATGAGNHQQRTFVVIHRPALIVVKAC